MAGVVTVPMCAKGLKRERSDSDGRKKEGAKVNFFVLDKFGLLPIQMDEPCPFRCSSVMSFWRPWPFSAYFCLVLWQVWDRA